MRVRKLPVLTSGVNFICWSLPLRNWSLICIAWLVCVAQDERGKKYNSFSTESDGDVTQEQMEAYMQAKPNWDDPMNNMKDTV